MLRTPHIAVAAALIATLGLLAACSSAPTAPAPGSRAPEPSAAPSAAVPASPAAGPEVRMITDKGEITLELNTKASPKTVANFLKLVGSGFYDGLRVHRVEAAFVVQAGDPLTRGLSGEELVAILARRQSGSPKAGDPAIGTGGPGWSIPFEENDLLHDRGVIAMARSQDPDSAGSQFYLTLAPAHFLDGDYVVFGHVTQGMDVVDRLAVGDKILSAAVIEE